MDDEAVEDTEEEEEEKRKQESKKQQQKEGGQGFLSYFKPSNWLPKRKNEAYLPDDTSPRVRDLTNK